MKNPAIPVIGIEVIHVCCHLSSRDVQWRTQREKVRKFNQDFFVKNLKNLRKKCKANKFLNLWKNFQVERHIVGLLRKWTSPASVSETSRSPADNLGPRPPKQRPQLSCDAYRNFDRAKRLLSQHLTA